MTDIVRTWPRAEARPGWWRRPAAVRAPGAAAPGAEPSTVAFRALLVFTFILLTAPQNLVPALAPLRIALLAAAVAIVAHVWHGFSHGRRPAPAPRELRITLGLAGWAALSVTVSYWPGGSLAYLLTVYLKTIAIFWLLGELVTTLGRLRRIAWALTLLSLPLAITAVRHFLGGDFLADATGVKRIVGFEAPLTENPNDLALILNLILPLAVALMLSARTPLRRGLLLAIVALNAVAIVLTFSRAGFLTLVTILVASLWRLPARAGAQWRWLALALALVCLPLLPAGYGDRLETITDMNADRTGSAQARWSDALVAAGYVLEHPIIGAGIGMNTLALNEVRGPAWKAVHNVYLEYAVELGLPGLALFLALLVGALRTAAAVARRSAEGALDELGHLAGGIQTSLVAFALAGLFHPSGYQFPFYYFAGLAIALPAVHEAEAARAAGSAR
jgi:O-antigen ligase